MTDHRLPVTVTGLTDVEEVHGGAEYTLALRSDGPPPPPDTDPPTAPGQPSGTSSSPGTIALTWSAAADNVSTTLTYHVFRDGLSAGAVTSAGPVVGFTDVGLQAGDSHVYTVTAVDAANNEGPASPPSDPIVVAGGPTAIFSDDFSSGTLTNWSAITRFTIDATAGSLAPPSARVSVSNQTATMSRALGGSYPNICLSARLNVTARTGSVGLWRLRTAADGPIARVWLTDTGILSIRSDVSGVTRSSAVALGTGWHLVEMCGTVGTASTWNLYRDGVQIMNAWVANTGTVPVGRIELGNTNAGTWTANFDDIQVDQSPRRETCSARAGPRYLSDESAGSSVQNVTAKGWLPDLPNWKRSALKPIAGAGICLHDLRRPGAVGPIEELDRDASPSGGSRATRCEPTCAC